MAFLRFCALTLLSLRALTAFAKDSSSEESTSPPQSPNLAIKISTSFPSSEIFGIKLINGHPTQALLSISNDEPQPINVVFIGGSLWTTDFTIQPPQIVRNLTTTRYDVEIPAGEKESISYSFATELQPQDLKLNLAVVITDAEGAPYTLQAFNETVAVVEPDTSIFDPQMFDLPFPSLQYPQLPSPDLIHTNASPIFSAYSSTSSSSPSSPVPSTSSTKPGSRPSSRRNGVAAKERSGPRNRQRVPKR
ncbi:MAG: hypothetical protein Q9190_008073 [Brigantiaea leucoxantha]